MFLCLIRGVGNGWRKGWRKKEGVLPIKEVMKDHKLAVFGIVSCRDKAKGVSCLEEQCKDHNVNFISHKIASPRSHFNQDCLRLNGRDAKKCYF